MSFTEYVLVAAAVLCFLASFVLFVRAKSEQSLQLRARSRQTKSGDAQAARPDRYGFHRMGHCLPWW